MGPYTQCNKQTQTDSQISDCQYQGNPERKTRYTGFVTISLKQNK